MNLDGDELLGQIQKDWPTEFELSRLRLLVACQQREIERLTALAPQPTDGYGRPFPDNLEVTRNDLTLG